MTTAQKTDLFTCNDCGASFRLTSVEVLEDTIEFCPFCGETFCDVEDLEDEAKE
jgi:uncharacterized paraquat-inducible protein A